MKLEFDPQVKEEVEAVYEAILNLRIKFGGIYKLWVPKKDEEGENEQNS